MSTTVKAGDTVAVHYTGKLADGTVFDTSRDRQPIKFVPGERQLIPGFEDAVIGMNAGESKSAAIEAADAYGIHQSALVVEFQREQIPPDVDVRVGNELQVQTTGGQSMPARVVDASDVAVTLDANHPLAGKDLVFEIELVEIIPAP